MASTLTTVAIFLPVLLLNDVEGQLFADLALTIACAVTVSMVVAVTVLPAVAARWMGHERLIDPPSACGRATRHVIRWTPPPQALGHHRPDDDGACAGELVDAAQDELPAGCEADAIDVWMSFTPGSISRPSGRR